MVGRHRGRNLERSEYFFQIANKNIKTMRFLKALKSKMKTKSE